ncbi:MAG TPA: hypothetical protein VJ917_05335 [Saprospiraceae bacterium]|nr:hypothetical protein [Saprospiraceae bacterium]
MKKMILLILGNLWIGLTRAYDIYCTYEFTPDLDREANPLVTILGIKDWSILLAIIVPLILYSMYCWYDQLYRFQWQISDQVASFEDFFTLNYFGERTRWFKVLYSFPLSLRQNHRLATIFLPPALMLAGVMSTLMWMGIRSPWDWYASIHSPWLIWTMLTVGTFIIFYIRMKMAYRQFLFKTID